MFYEIFSDEAAFAAHQETAYFKQIILEEALPRLSHRERVAYQLVYEGRDWWPGLLLVCRHWCLARDGFMGWVRHPMPWPCMPSTSKRFASGSTAQAQMALSVAR
jgi:hypothetical protein